MQTIISQNWLIQFRWCLLALTLSGFFISSFIEINTDANFAVILFSSVIIISNLALKSKFLKLFNQKSLLFVLILDTLLTSLVLYYLGGATNPFSILFLVYVVFSSILLSPLSTALILSISILCFGLLLKSTPEHHMHHSSGYSSHLVGMWIAYSLVAIICAFTISALVNLLKKSLKTTETLTSNQHRLSSLTTIAAGAAHELRTPLNTISLCVEDAKILIKDTKNLKEVNTQLDLISNQISRCSQIIRDLGINSSDIEGEKLTKTTLTNFIAEIFLDYKDKINLDTHLLPQITLQIPKLATKRAVRSLIQNALESSEKPTVDVEVNFNNNFLIFKIEDDGPGIDPIIEERIGEPFVTSKPPGNGMGLGVFLSKLTANAYGGDLVFDKSFKNGTRVFFSIKV